jgi:hypothetical protein
MKTWRIITAIFIIGFITSVVVILFVGFVVFSSQTQDEPPAPVIPYSSSIENEAQAEGLYDQTQEPIIHHVNDLYNGQHN